MKKIESISNLVVEVTRRCNMKCMHCLRGGVQNKNIDLRYIDTLLNQVENINGVTFTGGEPSLYVEAISCFLDRAKEKGINIGFFYIATNGLKINEDFVVACLKLYSYCWEKEMCMVQVSNDYYHAEEGNYNTNLLDGLSFFSRKSEKESDNYGAGRYLINEGRALSNFGKGGRDLDISPIEDAEDFNESEIYLNCNGEIVNGCDLSYVNQKKHILCNVSELAQYYNTLDTFVPAK